MDTTETVTHVSLCAGYGGIDLGLKRCIPNMRTIAFSEIEAFACELLLSRMEAGQLDAAPIWSDLKSFPWDAFHGKVHILSGGYPCQPFSAAGLRKGADDPRHLWPFIADGIARMRPELCFFENVEGHVSLGLREVIGELESLGYRTTWGLFSAAEVGAPHQRKRVFILAHRNESRLEGLWANARQSLQSESGDSGASLWPSRPGQPQFAWEPPRVVGQVQLGNASHSGHARAKGQGGSGSQGQSDGHAAQSTGRTAQPTLGGDADGPAGGLDYAELCVSYDNRTDELRLLGNGVVPATAERAFRVLAGRLFQ